MKCYVNGNIVLNFSKEVINGGSGSYNPYIDLQISAGDEIKCDYTTYVYGKTTACPGILTNEMCRYSDFAQTGTNKNKQPDTKYKLGEET